MTVRDFFELFEKANEFKTLIGEQKTKLQVFAHGSIGYVTSFEEFKKAIEDRLCSASAKAILSAEVEETICVRVFRINYLFDGYKMHCDLCAE